MSTAVSRVAHGRRVLRVRGAAPGSTRHCGTPGAAFLRYDARDQITGGLSGGGLRTPKTSRSATRAALSPHWPSTAGPGGVAADAR
jgi:hypothetical protein